MRSILPAGPHADDRRRLEQPAKTRKTVGGLHLDTRCRAARAQVPGLRCAARVPAKRDQRREADRAVGLLRLPRLWSVRLPRTHAAAAARPVTPPRRVLGGEEL